MHNGDVESIKECDHFGEKIWNGSDAINCGGCGVVLPVTLKNVGQALRREYERAEHWHREYNTLLAERTEGAN